MSNINSTELQNKIIKQKINQNNDIFLFVKTNVPFKPFVINDSLYSQNGDNVLVLYNKVDLISQNIHAVPVSSFYKYINDLGLKGVGAVSFRIRDILSRNFSKVEIDACKNIVSKYKYYVVLVDNKYNKICLGANTKIQDVKKVELTKVKSVEKIYPNILGIPPQFGPINLSIPLMFGIMIGIISLGLYFFKKKYS